MQHDNEIDICRGRTVTFGCAYFIRIRLIIIVSLLQNVAIIKVKPVISVVFACKAIWFDSPKPSELEGQHNPMPEPVIGIRHLSLKLFLFQHFILKRFPPEADKNIQILKEMWIHPHGVDEKWWNALVVVKVMVMHVPKAQRPSK